jgi:putative membrane protein
MEEPESNPTKHARVPEEKRATEYLANERTFLAWIRTSIALISVGFLITRFGVWIHFSQMSEPTGSPKFGKAFVMGVAMMALGAVIAIAATRRYHVVNRAIDEGRVQADRGLVILVTILVVTLTAAIIAFMLFTD